MREEYHIEQQDEVLRKLSHIAHLGQIATELKDVLGQSRHAGV